MYRLDKRLICPSKNAEPFKRVENVRGSNMRACSETKNVL